jgi:tellurite resistance protein TehA-like permease
MGRPAGRPAPRPAAPRPAEPSRGPRGVAAVRAGVRTLDPGYFALVMATGIVSVTAGYLHLPRVSAGLLAVTAVCWVGLAVGYGWRAVAATAEFVGDLRAPDRAFAFFTVVAGSEVLATRLAFDGHRWLALALSAVGAAVWLALSYVVPLRVIAGPRTEGVLAAANGTWLVWVVATQSMSLVLTASAPLWPAHTADLALVAVAGWGVGVVLYLMLMTVVLLRLLLYPVLADDLTPPYWISMGATAITVHAGARLLDLPPAPALDSARPVVIGLSIVLWAFGTWLWPPLLAWTLRRLVLHGGSRPSYRPATWSAVFPLGMYAVCSMELGKAVRAPWIDDVGRAEGWLALTGWAVVFVAMLASLTPRPHRARARTLSG